MAMTKKLAVSIAHTLSQTSKMPGKSYSIPARYCQTGSKLRKQPGTVCASCYACKGAYAWSTTQVALEKRYASLSDPRWVDAMTTLIQGEEYFRWHDSGDIQSVEHLIRIVMVCENTPSTSHWLPTQESGLVREYLAQGYSIPSNLVIRISAPKVNSQPLSLAAINHSRIQSCRAVLGEDLDTDMKAGSRVCPAPQQKNSCGDCRACWNPSIADIIYIKH